MPSLQLGAVMPGQSAEKSTVCIPVMSMPLMPRPVMGCKGLNRGDVDGVADGVKSEVKGEGSIMTPPVGKKIPSAAVPWPVGGIVVEMVRGMMLDGEFVDELVAGALARGSGSL